MKTKNLRTPKRIGLLVLAALVVSLSGCATKKAAWGSLKKGMVMKYDAQPDKEVTYKTTFGLEQNMKVMEQEFSITADGDQLLILMPLSSDNEDLEYLVTVGEMTSTIETPRGTMEADLEDVVGKSFEFTVSRFGVELDFAGAKDITYDYGMGQEKSISSDIQAFFPDLPDHPVKAGDSWTSTDDILEEVGGNVVNIQFNNINTFEKLENFNGYDCMKVNVVFTGTIDGKGEQDGMDLITTGELSGTSTWYYAYKEGLFVSNVVDGTGKTETEVIGGPQEMVIPATRTYKMTSELYK